MNVSENKIAAEGVGDFIKNLGKTSVESAKNSDRNEMKNPSKALKIGAKNESAAASKTLNLLFYNF